MKSLTQFKNQKKERHEQKNQETHSEALRNVREYVLTVLNLVMNTDNLF
jgi:hypothetical protein